jgi:hypothetical protein
MALSASFDFTLNRDELIKRSLLMIGAVSPSQTIKTAVLTDAGQVLNLMLKAWQADGMQLWQVTGKSITPVEDQQEYTIGPSGTIVTPGKPVEILEAYRRVTADTSDVALIRQSRTQYWELNDKAATGVPVNYYWEIQSPVTSNSLFIWPTSDATFAANNTIEILYQAPFDDMDSGTDNLSFPQEWELAVVYGLAVILAPEYGVPLAERRVLREEAKEEKQRVLDWDQEHTSVFFQPEQRY